MKKFSIVTFSLLFLIFDPVCAKDTNPIDSFDSLKWGASVKKIKENYKKIEKRRQYYKNLETKTFLWVTEDKIFEDSAQISLLVNEKHGLVRGSFSVPFDKFQCERIFKKYKKILKVTLSKA